MIDRQELGVRLHMLRWRRGWSAHHVEELSGIPEATLLRWERAIGKRYPDVGRLADLVAVFGIELSELLNQEEVAS